MSDDEHVVAEKRGEGEKKTSQFNGREKEGKGVQRMSGKSLSLIIILTTIAFFCCCCLFISSTLSLLLIPLLSLLEWISLIYACFFFNTYERATLSTVLQS